MPEPIAVLGTAVDLPLGVDSVDKLFEVVREKRQLSLDMVAAGRLDFTDVQEGREHAWKLKNRYACAFTQAQVDHHDLTFFQIPAKAHKHLKAQQLAVLQAVYHAIEDAGLTLQDLHNTTTGVFVGAYSSFTCSPLAPDESSLRSLLMSAISDQVAYFLGTHGPSYSTETACSSSSVALSLAVQSLQRHECDVALVAGCNRTDSKDFPLALQAAGVLVEGPSSHPFDEDGPKGFLRCEGTGALVLRRLHDAEAHGDNVICEIAGALAGSAGAAEGASRGSSRVYESPCHTGMVEMMTRACRLANLSLTDVDYLECHATGTAVGDLIELEAIGAVYGASRSDGQPVRVASVKSNIGHAEMAAGIFSVIKVAESLRRRVFLPTAGVKTPRKAFDWAGQHLALQLEAEPFPSGRRVTMAVNSFGVGGSYAHILLREYQPSAQAPARVLTLHPCGPVEPPQLLLLSAYSRAHLGPFAADVSAYLKHDGCHTSLTDICGTMALRRTPFGFRRAFLAHSKQTMAEQLDRFLATNQAAALEASSDDQALRVAFIMTGQGSQWAQNGMELMHFPAYRTAVQHVDELFESLSGWSILEKIETLASADMTDTAYAQPITFLVQVGLLGLLHSFGVTPDVVLGHSAGEVAAAYAAGLLTLEEAVSVVYHRSCEQKKLAGSGRMLAIGLGEGEVVQLLQKEGLHRVVDLACVNSPSSVVLAGVEADLLRIKECLPSGISNSFIPGNIAFHSRRVDPILDSMRRRLAFLQQGSGGGEDTAAWSLPFVSTVTGRMATTVPAEYWCDNVRQPVLFHKAVESVWGGERAPEIMLELGPHRTLVTPFMQTLAAVGKDRSVTALSLLNKREPSCVASFLTGLGKLFERGVDINLKSYYEGAMRYSLDRRLPKHPYVKAPFDSELKYPLLYEMNARHLRAGPAAGMKRVGGNTWMVELSDRTCPYLMHHRIGGEPIVPGAWFAEMVLEAAGLPCTLTDVEFHGKLAIPRASAGDTPVLVLLVLSPAPDGSQAFVIKSCAMREKDYHDPVYVEHCVGHVYKGHHLLHSDGALRTHGPRPHGHGLLVDLPMQDIGANGIAQLHERHSRVEHTSKEGFYAVVSTEGLNEYGPIFQGVVEARVDPVSRSVMGRIEVDHEGWGREGGLVAPELLDSLAHLALLHMDKSIVCYVGGYEAMHVLRRPATRELYAVFVPDTQGVQVGRRKRSGDTLLYDAEGRLLLVLVGSFSILVPSSDHYKTLETTWQPLHVSTPLDALADIVKGYAEEEGCKDDGALGAVEQHERLSAYVQAKLNEGDESGGNAQALAEALLSAEESRVTPVLAKLTGKLGQEQRGEEEGTEGPTAEEELARLVSWGTGQEAEAGALARALLSLAQHEQGGHGKHYALRVLEVVECGDCPSVADSLYELPLPLNMTIEVFLASHSASFLSSLASRSRRQPGLVLRRLLLPSDASPGQVLGDLTFHALVVDDWARTCAGSGASGLLEKVSPLLLPGAHVMVRGFCPTPEWARQLDMRLHSLSPSVMAADAEAEAIAEARNDWLSTLQALGGQVAWTEGVSMLLSRLPQLLPQRGGRFVVAVETIAQGEQVASALKTATQQGVVVDVVPLIVDDLVTAQELAAQLEMALEQPVEAFVFAAALDDPSVIGEGAHSRLLRFMQALSRVDTLLIEQLNTQRHVQGQPLRERPHVYVLSEGVYGGKIRPNQGVLSGFIRVLPYEMGAVSYVHADLATSGDHSRAELLETAMALVLSDCRESTFCVHGTGEVMAPRLQALEHDKARRVEVLPSDDRCYHAAVTSTRSEGSQVLMPGVVHASFQLCPLPPLQDDEVVVEIEAAALNFRDVMISLSLLPEQSYERSFFGKNFGMEAAGVVSQVGRGVTSLRVGDRVAVAEPRTFANRVIAKAQRVTPLSDGVSFVEAASMQSVYNTCHYALVDQARVRKGETVLIHSAAGGVGHAAIAICQHLGAHIIATAGSEEKRAMVRAMGVKHVFDSRSTSWYEDVMKATEGEGVSVVLNSLAGVHQRLGLQALRSSGRFCEIGKVDIFANNQLGLLAFRKNISFFAIDMDRLALDDPGMTQQVMFDVAKHVAAGHYRPLPVTLFPMGQIKQALELMKSGRHVGKVVLVNRDAQGRECPVAVDQCSNTFRPDATYLVTGGAGGFGHRLISHAVWSGARHFVVTTTKRDIEAVRAQVFSDVLVRHPNVTIDLVTCDTGKREDMQQLMAHAKTVSPPVKGIFHVAGVAGDVRLAEMKDREDYAKVAKCKALGAWLLHELSLDMDIETFVTISSSAARLGGMGNAAYAPANAFLDTLVRYRRSQGLAGHSYNMNALSDVGLLLHNTTARTFQRKLGAEFMTSQQALETLELAMVTGHEQLFSQYITEQLCQQVSHRAELSHVLQDPIALGLATCTIGAQSAKDITRTLLDEIKSITQATEVQANSPLVNAGLDSFAFIELGGRIQKMFGLEVSSLKLTPDKTISELASLIYKLQRREAGGEAQTGEAQEGEDHDLLETGVRRKDVAPLLDLRAPGRRLSPALAAKQLEARRWRVGGEAILLLGATGLTGAHLLRYLIKMGDAKRVYCLVRASSREVALVRVRKALQQLGIWKDSLAPHIIAMPGDVAKDGFGLSEADLREVKANVTGVVHAAGSRTWAMDRQATDCHVAGLLRTAALAGEAHVPLHFVSASWLDMYDRATPSDKQALATLPYVSMKLRAEQALAFAARQCHVACNVIRCPIVFINRRGGFAGDVMVFTAMQGIYAARACYEPLLYACMPADLVAKEFVRQMRRGPRVGSPSLYRLHSLVSICDMISTTELADLVDEVITDGRYVDRTVSEANMRATLDAIFGEEAVDITGMMAWTQAAARAGQLLKAEQNGWRTQVAKRIAYNSLSGSRNSHALLREYVRARPELIVARPSVQAITQDIVRIAGGGLKKGGRNCDGDVVPQMAQ